MWYLFTLLIYILFIKFSVANIYIVFLMAKTKGQIIFAVVKSMVIIDKC